MRRSLLAATAALCLLGSTLVAATPSAQATVGFSQTVILKGDPTLAKGINRKYTSFTDGSKDCSWQGGGSGSGGDSSCSRSIGGGKINILPQTFKLKEGMKKHDYYLLDLTVSTSKIFGNKDYAYLDATLTSTSPVTSATYSRGVSEVDKCKKYPIDIAAGWGPVSAGTTVGSFTVNCHRTYVTRAAVSSGQSYHVTNLNAVKNVTFQRFVVVPAGTKPKFGYSVSWPTDYCHTQTVGTASGSQQYKECRNREGSITRGISTKG